ncbi:MAG: TetR/AcrR family transcriptional regulator [Actinomycetales bacterium]|nr:TetR/AcrR family transcriptional regulator [Actinomycetales bacterium]
MDPRVARTRERLQTALFDLARERPLEEITVADIADRAEVNRSTFYQHYSDKDVLLADALDAVAETAGAALPERIPVGGEPPLALRVFLEHLDENAELYRQLIAERGAGAGGARLGARIERIVLDALPRADRGLEYEIPPDVIAASVAGSVLGVLRAWLARDPRPSVDVAVSWVWRSLLGPGDGGSRG